MAHVEEYSASRLKRLLDENMDGCGSRPRGKSRLAKALRMNKSGSQGLVGSVSPNNAPLSVTPSMSSVLSQVKSYRSARTGSSGDSFACGSGSYGSSSGSRSSWEWNYELSASVPLIRQDSLDDWPPSSSSSPAPSLPMQEHPLGDPLQYCDPLDDTQAKLASEPRLRLVNPQDLDLAEEYMVSDILQLYQPVYQRAKVNYIHKQQPTSGPRRTSVDLTIDTKTNVGTAQVLDTNATTSGNRIRSSVMLCDSEQVELENWPRQQSHELHAQPKPAPPTPVEAAPNTTTSAPNRRIRQQTFNPNFLKLYAMETTSKARNLIPDLNVDEQVLRKLDFKDIWNLEIPAASQTHNVSAHGIKLALITRKKLWSEMMCEPRLDLHGDNAPWNLKFIVSPTDLHDSGPVAPSLVRVNSALKPWTSLSSKMMLRPSGKLQLARARPGVPTRELQYVVKGWCDSRFTGE
ncbi:LANO_0C06744g1_1 [Lachancea nothofagi CBS 11611]|uniref:LANO_0C06744g1_1 n=1 Tax=Lachancea nothofagi CBS 11611 TaxID=1266666 RepID=A0A1G4J860_9SACH|nr:LANO_0C06744g1_1 [Lachancea nothofagi CBS 11611]